MWSSSSKCWGGQEWLNKRAPLNLARRQHLTNTVAKANPEPVALRMTASYNNHGDCRQFLHSVDRIDQVSARDIIRVVKRYLKNTKYIKNNLQGKDRQRFEQTAELFKKYADK